MDSEGLHLDGHDIGPGTWPVSDDGEYEWWDTIAPEHFPRLREVLDMPPDANVCAHIIRFWSGSRTYELTRRINASGIPIERRIWSG